MMRKIVCVSTVLSCFFVFQTNLFAQDNVGIGTTNPRSTALLDLSSPDKGLLLPRVDRTAMTLGALDHGMVVFDTVSNALFIWDGTAFQTLALASNFWSISGNAGTLDGTNFIGTTDNVPLNLRVNNVQAGRLTAAGVTTYGVQAGLNNTAITSVAIGFRALGTNTSGINNTAVGYGALTVNTGERNTAVGTNTLSSNTSGNNNTAVGDRVLTANTTGSANTGVGLTALFSNTTGLRNSAFGWDALFSNTIGTDNVAIGYRAGFTNVNGLGNVFIGENADASDTNFVNAIAIGSGALVGQSNSMVLGNLVNVGIGTSTPTARLEVQGASPGAGNGIGEFYHPASFGWGVFSVASSGGDGTGTAFAAARIAGLENNPTGTSNVGVWGHQTGLGAGGWGVIASNGASETAPDRYVALAGHSANPYSGIFMGGNVGLGVAAPVNLLDIEGGAVVGANYSGTNTAPTNGMLIEGNVGIGNNNPSTRLEVRAPSPGAGNGVIEAYQTQVAGWGIVSSNSDNGDNTGTVFTRTRIAGIENNPTGNTNAGVWGHQFGNGSGGWGLLASNGASELAPDRYVALAGHSATPYSGIFMGGNVGLGVTAPVNLLDVEGAAVVGANYSGTSTAPTNGMLIEGNVGIGNNNPSTRLEVRAPSPGNGNGAMEVYHSSNFGWSILTSSSTGGDNTGTVYTRARIGGIESNPTGSTNVGVWGHQFGNGAGGWGVVASNGASETAPTTYAAFGGQAYAGIMMNGFVGVNTTTPATSLHVNHPTGITNGLSISNAGDADRWHFYCWSSNSLYLYFNNTQMGLFNSVSGVYTALSDRRFKSDIQEMPSVLDKIDQLEPVNYRFNHQNPSDDTKYMGFIAQDVEQVFPSLVVQTKSDDPAESEGGLNDVYTLDYSGFGVIAIKAIQELRRENQELRSRIEALESK